MKGRNQGFWLEQQKCRSALYSSGWHQNTENNLEFHCAGVKFEMLREVKELLDIWLWRLRSLDRKRESSGYTEMDCVLNYGIKKTKKLTVPYFRIWTEEEPTKMKKSPWKKRKEKCSNTKGEDFKKEWSLQMLRKDQDRGKFSLDLTMLKSLANLTKIVFAVWKTAKLKDF